MRHQRRGRGVRLLRDGEEPVMLVSLLIVEAAVKGRGGDGEVVRLDQVILALMDPGKTPQCTETTMRTRASDTCEYLAVYPVFSKNGGKGHALSFCAS